MKIDQNYFLLEINILSLFVPLKLFIIKRLIPFLNYYDKYWKN